MALPGDIFPELDVEELRTRIANYKQSRKTAAPSIRRWLDLLISEAEEKLHGLTQGKGGAPALASASRSDPGPDPDDERRNYRRTYPFDECAPWQRASQPEPRNQNDPAGNEEPDGA